METALILPKKTTKIPISNQLINGRRKPQLIKTPGSAPYSVNTQRLLALLISQATLQKDKSFVEFSVSTKDLWKALGLKYRPTTNNVLQIAGEAVGVIWWVRKPSSSPGTSQQDRWETVRWVEKASYDEGTGQVTLQLSTDLAPHILNLKKDFTQFYIHSLSLLRSPYSMLLYRFLRQFSYYTRKKHCVELPDLLAALDIPTRSRYFAEWSYFAADVLHPAVQQINKKTELRAFYTPVRDAGNVIAVEFTVEERKDLISQWHRTDRGLTKYA